MNSVRGDISKPNEITRWDIKAWNDFERQRLIATGRDKIVATLRCIAMCDTPSDANIRVWPGSKLFKVMLKRELVTVSRRFTGQCHNGRWSYLNNYDLTDKGREVMNGGSLGTDIRLPKSERQERHLGTRG